jgi:hypothetical protein
MNADRGSSSMWRKRILAGLACAALVTMGGVLDLGP